MGGVYIIIYWKRTVAGNKEKEGTFGGGKRGESIYQWGEQCDQLWGIIFLLEEGGGQFCWQQWGEKIVF